MCMHRFYVAPHEAAQPSHLLSNQHGSSPKIQVGNMNCKVEPHKMHICPLKMQGFDDGIKIVSYNPTAEGRIINGN
jgi:hypothetical protein